MPRSDPTPVWVLQKTRELVARATPAHIIAGIITAAGYPANARQVRRWKEKHGIKSQWAGDDGQLDQIMQQLRDDDELGEQEGYRWVHSVVNAAIPGDERVGEKRVRAAVKRAMPAAVAARNDIIETRLQRRVYVADYAGQNDHLDLECKIIVGSVRMYIFGLADGDSRYLKLLPLLFVKTARSTFLHGYLAAVGNDGLRAADRTTADAGREWVIMRYALEAQGLRWNPTRSVHNTRIERPWLDVAIKVVRITLRATDALQADGVHVLADVHHEYALRATLFIALSYGLEEFRTRYNEHNVPGPRGGVPSYRHEMRTRPASAPAQSFFDDSIDWCARYAAHIGAQHHTEDHFVQAYAYEVIRLVQAQQAGLPSPEHVWKDMKRHVGKRGEFRQLYAVALGASRARATAASIRASERACMRARGARMLSED
jgi:hypothetical protein|tara:strand:- start:42 stop:1331 length:1290 start_codon:yes stop_codon:yes gene_type:complete